MATAYQTKTPRDPMDPRPVDPNLASRPIIRDESSGSVWGIVAAVAAVLIAVAAYLTYTNGSLMSPAPAPQITTEQPATPSAPAAPATEAPATPSAPSDTTNEGTAPAPTTTPTAPATGTSGSTTTP